MNKLLFLLLLSTGMLFLSNNLKAQEPVASEKEMEVPFPDEKTRNPEQNAQWKTGEGKFSARPRDMWELGIGAGTFLVTGDVPSTLPGGYGIHLHARKAVNYAISIRGELTFGQSSGQDYRLISKAHGTREYPDVGMLYSGTMPRAYQVTYYGAELQGIVNIGNLLFHSQSNNWNAYLLLGIGLHTHDTRMDFLDSNGNPYDFSSIPDDATLPVDRRERRSAIRDILDNDYETRGSIKATGLRLNDNMNLLGHFTAGIGISRRLNRRVNLALEYNVKFADNDHVDGIIYRNATSLTKNRDILHFTSIRLGINLGSFDTRTEPLYWVNPLDAVLNDVAELKRRPVFDLTDSDGDGVIDLLDTEPDTPEGAVVDVKGRILDSDGDGIPDYQDKEPFSSPGFEVDSDGVAQVPKYMTEDDVRTIVNEVVNTKLENIKTEWYLPTIHFDLDKYFVKPEFYGELNQIAQVMKAHPDLKVVASGHTDVRGSQEYNEVLSYNRANAAIQYLVNRYNIPRERFLIHYSGKSENLVEGLPESYGLSNEKERHQYLNRRVEFKVAQPTDEEMEAPEGPTAGKNTPGSSRKGTKYSGSKNVGY